MSALQTVEPRHWRQQQNNDRPLQRHVFVNHDTRTIRCDRSADVHAYLRRAVIVRRYRQSGKKRGELLLARSRPGFGKVTCHP